MGFKYPAKVEFDRMDLSNEDTEKALLIQLADRSIISDELIQTRFGFDPDMEKSRLNRESRERESNRMVNKSGPWHDPQLDNSLKKIALQTGIVSPSQVGLELEKKKSGEKTAMELKVPQIPSSKPTKLANDSPESLPGQPQQGRPKNSTDTQKRKPKVFTPQTGASVMIWANRAQDKINEIINPVLLSFYNKKNLRSLTASETKEAETIKTKILFALEPNSKISQESIMDGFNKIDDQNINSQFNSYSKWLKTISSETNMDLSVEDIKHAKASFYFMVYNNP